MRRRLVVVGLATTLLVVISLIVPLGLLVRRQAADRARVAAEREAQSTAALVTLAVTLDTPADVIADIANRLDPGVIIVLEDGSVFGQPIPGQGELVSSSMENQATITSVVPGGWEIALPVIGAEAIAVVDAFTTDAELTDGVAEAWTLLAALGVVLVGLAVLVADRMGKSLVVPMRDLAGAAHVMSEGDLEARVDTNSMTGVPPEIVEVGEAFNTLALRLDHLLAEEREAVADLSHRLRTPLTSLRLQAEKISDASEKTETLAQVDRMEEAIDTLILASRSRASSVPGVCRLDEVAAERCAFWRILADEEEREFTVDLAAGASELSLSADQVGVVVDALIGNVFAHTPPGTPFGLSTGEEKNRLWIEVFDRGRGFTDEALVARGASGRGSTGLGLDIARRAAEMTGGRLELNDRPGGGAVVRAWFG